jgi:hypothetical protein
MLDRTYYYDASLASRVAMSDNRERQAEAFLVPDPLLSFIVLLLL